MKNELFKLNVPVLKDRPDVLADLQSDIDFLVSANKIKAAEKRKDEIEKFYARRIS